MEQQTQEIRLTQFSHGGGCGCKIAPSVLEEILKTNAPELHTKNLLVGNSSKDDAAAYDLGNGTALIATTDFFMPIVDDPTNFGKIAAANAVSDVYAMGGRPIMAIAILGWPVQKLPVDIAQKVLDGARAICSEAGIPLAGGHSIDTTEPVFGLAVNGLCNIGDLKQNNTAQEGDLLFLTKPIGTGILSTAQKRGKLSEEHLAVLTKQMCTVNKVGEALGKIKEVSAMTDVTGFGLAGHLVEMTEGSGLSAELYYSSDLLMPGLKEYLAQKIMPDATYRNWNAYSNKISFDPGVDVMESFSTLPDPQTNGGLLIAVNAKAADKVITVLRENGYDAHTKPIGRMVRKGEKTIVVKQAI
jgi:selenide,water dikinase